MKLLGPGHKHIEDSRIFLWVHALDEKDRRRIWMQVGTCAQCWKVFCDFVFPFMGTERVVRELRE